MLWGAALSATDSKLVSAVGAREQNTGRALDVVHVYHRFFDDFPTGAERSLADDGHVLFVNWEPVQRTGTPMLWSAVASGSQDAAITAEARRLAALDRTVFVSFSHEPEQRFHEHGDAAAFAAAFRHVVTLSRAAGAGKVRWVWDVMGLSDPVWHQRYLQLWPGDQYVDWVAWDPYNFAGCRDRAWQSFEQTVRPFYQWLQANGFGTKPFMLAEYGTVERPGQPGAKAQWLASVPAVMGRLPNLRALIYFDLPSPPANCDWLVATSPGAQHAYAQLARNPMFGFVDSRRGG